MPVSKNIWSNGHEDTIGKSLSSVTQFLFNNVTNGFQQRWVRWRLLFEKVQPFFFNFVFTVGDEKKEPGHFKIEAATAVRTDNVQMGLGASSKSWAISFVHFIFAVLWHCHRDSQTFEADTTQAGRKSGAHIRLRPPRSEASRLKAF